MAKRGFSISVKPDRHTEDYFRMIQEWPQRTKALMGQFTYDAAEDVKKGILARLPTTGEAKDYRKGLQVAQVDGLSGNAQGHALFVFTKSKRVKKSDRKNTLIYIKVSKKLKRPSARVVALEKYGPWPIDMLPFKPSSAEAKTISRKVRPSEVTSRRKTMTRTRKMWRGALVKAGVSDKQAKRSPKLSKQLRAVPDLAFTALRMEFGVGGQKTRAHWRPSLLELMRVRIPTQARKRTQYDRVMADPKAKMWLGWPKRTRERLRAGQMGQFKDFQDRLGLRV